MLTKIVFSVTFSLSVDSQLTRFNCNSVVSVLSIPGGLNLYLQLFVLDLFVTDVLVYYFYTCFENLDNVCYFY